MFVWLNKQGVQSDHGFVVQFTGRFTAEYRDHGRVVTLSVEDGLINGEHCIIVDPDAFARWDDSTTISKHEQMQMLQNLRAAFEFQGLKLVLEKRQEWGQKE